MAIHLEEQMKNPSNQNLSFEDRLELLLYAEITAKRNRKIHRLLKSSKLLLFKFRFLISVIVKARTHIGKLSIKY